MFNNTVDYAWTITHDYVEDGDAEGVSGPRGATDERISAAQSSKALGDDLERYTFRMYDGDDELYYRGVLVVSKDCEDFEDAIVAPLDNFGGPNAGCVMIKYNNHPEFDCEW